MVEILSLLALNANIANILSLQKIEAMNNAEKTLANELERYLENIDTVSR